MDGFREYAVNVVSSGNIRQISWWCSVSQAAAQIWAGCSSEQEYVVLLAGCVGIDLADLVLMVILVQLASWEFHFSPWYSCFCIALGCQYEKVNIHLQ